MHKQKVKDKKKEILNSAGVLLHVRIINMLKIIKYSNPLHDTYMLRKACDPYCHRDPDTSEKSVVLLPGKEPGGRRACVGRTGG